ncbi:membrane-associated HD superfamily phosphohydrolase [Paenibacillus turicensis]|uniref:Membrane-associated HD superfamily phosphohydrolase n=1 Tax=Paenibacillus turicensis TaxID=160487 RepID=A0ABS4FW64_9BACL|nr:hypothetical protein [Paenibacillus turicensis]MBP1906760.1 membrane-associated HD superfamily phosphohydrolase [Paenibacillus turicensis]
MLSLLIVVVCIFLIFLNILTKSKNKLKDVSLSLSFIFSLNAVLLACYHSRLINSESSIEYLYIFTLKLDEIYSFLMFSLATALISFAVFIFAKNKN